MGDKHKVNVSNRKHSAIWIVLNVKSILDNSSYSQKKVIIVTTRDKYLNVR